MKVIESGEFQGAIQNGVSVIDFYADWCGPCKMLAPVFEELSAEMKGSVEFFKLDVDQSQDIAVKYQVSTIPTVIIFKDGKEVERTIGFLPKDAIKSKINQFI